MFYIPKNNNIINPTWVQRITVTNNVDNYKEQSKSLIFYLGIECNDDDNDGTCDVRDLQDIKIENISGKNSLKIYKYNYLCQ